MITKSDLIGILKINGVPIDSPDDYISSILLNARYTKSEIDEALFVLRNGDSVEDGQKNGLHKLFRSDGSLRPDEITQLLGIEVNERDLIHKATKKHTISTKLLILMWILSFLLAGTGILVYMYVSQVGIFHPSVTLTMQ